MAIDSYDVAAELDTFFSADPFASGENLAAINVAIDRSWPTIKFTEYDADDFSLSAGTHLYTPTPTQTLTEWGFAHVFVDAFGSRPDRPVSDVWQINDAGTWKLKFTERFVDNYSGQSVSLLYHYKHARLSEIGADGAGDLDLPFDYVFNRAGLYLAMQGLSKGHDVDVEVYRDWIAMFRDEAQQAKMNGWVAPLPSMRRFAPPRTALYIEQRTTDTT